MPSLINGAVISLEMPPRTAVVLEAPPSTPPVLTVVRGPKGEQGDPGDGADLEIDPTLVFENALY